MIFMEIISMEGLQSKILEMMALNNVNLSKLLGIVCGIGMLFYFGYKIWPTIVNAEAPDLLSIARVFLIFLVTLYFNILVIQPLNGVLSITTSYTEELKRVNDAVQAQNYQKLKDNAVVSSANVARSKGQNPDDVGFFGNVWNGLIGIGKTVVQGIGSILGSIINISQSIFMAIGYALFGWMRPLMMGVRDISLIIMAILGPLAFAIAIFPGMSSNIQHFLVTYVSIYLWLPVANLIDFIIDFLYNQHAIGAFSVGMFNDSPILDPDAITTTTETMNGSGMYAFVGITMYLFIPKITSYIVKGGDDGAMAGGLKGLISGAFAIAGSFIGGAAGGSVAAKAAGGAAQAAAKTTEGK